MPRENLISCRIMMISISSQQNKAWILLNKIVASINPRHKLVCGLTENYFFEMYNQGRLEHRLCFATVLPNMALLPI